jgi:DNA repair ATPase RecN
MQCDVCGKDATDGWQNTYCNPCAIEVDADAMESRLDKLTEECESKEERLRDCKNLSWRYRADSKQVRVEVDRFQRKLARLQRQVSPFVELVSLAREARDCGSPEARTLFVAAAVAAAIVGCANVSVGDNDLVPAPEDL